MRPMHRFGSPRTLALAAVALALILAGLRAHAAEQRHYLQLESGNLVIISAIGEPQTRQIAERIVTFRTALESALGVQLPGGLPTRLYALNKEDWERYARPRSNVSGYFVAHPFASDLLLNAQDGTASAYELIFHEYTHHVLRTSLTVELPAFVDEGLAELFSTAQIGEGGVRIGLRPDHARYLRGHEWMPFEHLIGIRRTDPEYVDHALAPAFYAQAWATLYYAAALDHPYGWRVMQYVRATESGMSAAQAAARLVGGNPDRVNAEIAEFVKRKHAATSLTIPLEQNTAIEHATVRKLDHEESTLALGELLLQLGGRHARALELFNGAQQSQPASSRARVGAGWAHLQAGQPSAAGEIFDSTPNPSPLDCRTSVALGRGLFQLAVENLGARKPDGIRRERLIRARGLFATSLEDPRVGLEAVNGFVLTKLALDEADESLITLAQKAYAAAPKSSELGVALAILHEVGGRKDVARRYWQEAARNTHAAPVRARILDELR